MSKSISSSGPLFPQVNPSRCSPPQSHGDHPRLCVSVQGACWNRRLCTRHLLLEAFQRLSQQTCVFFSPEPHIAFCPIFCPPTFPVFEPHFQKWVILSVEYKFIQNHFHPKRENVIQNHFHPNTTFIQNHFHPMTTFIPKPVSSQNIFIQNQFHPKTILMWEQQQTRRRCGGKTILSVRPAMLHMKACWNPKGGSLPMRFGGLAMRSAMRMSHAAYWASWADALRRLWGFRCFRCLGVLVFRVLDVFEV